MTHTTETTQHNVYVIELDKEVLKFDEFIKANPQYKQGMPCLYVGETRHTPQKRFNYHLVGYKTHEFVRRYARRLAPEYYASIKPVDSDHARIEEQKLADQLRALGYAVWQHENALNSESMRKKPRYVGQYDWHHHFAGA
ncbi:MAG: hypothetical protein JSW45_00425 [Thiotrichales bacterium]|nr:MAG: hypothetical protein JSW45_00425 [Thiotrichales bacterium]